MNTSRLDQSILAVVLKREPVTGDMIKAEIDPFGLMSEEINTSVWRLVDRGQLHWRTDRAFEIVPMS